jgi:hypothetical protein
MYAVGGIDNVELSSAERFDPVKGQWEVIAPLENVNENPVMCILGDSMYTMGEKNQQGTFEEYDNVNNTWTDAPSLDYSIKAAGVVRNEIVVIPNNSTNPAMKYSKWTGKGWLPI